MKTSKILMAMALPVAFAACTSEELVESTQNALDNRKVLGDIEVVMGTDSRFAQSGEGWIFNDGDAFGAALVDVFNGGKDANAIKNYDLTNYIQTNYQYAKGEGNTWTTPARMVEGNYVFYAPFNPNHLSRKPIEVITPLSQTLDVNDGVVDSYSTINNLLSAENPNPMFVAYQFLSAEDQATSIAVDMKHIFAYPEVTIENKTKEDVEIFKFVISTGTKTFPVKAPLSVYTSTSSNIASKDAGGVVGALFNYGTESTTNKYGSWVNKDVKNGLAGYTADLLNTAAAPMSNLIVVEIPEGLTIEAGESESFNVVMPAMEYDGFTVYAYTSDEEGYSIKMSKVATFYSGKRYPKQEYNNGNVVASKAGKIMTATIDKDAEVESLDEDFPVVVSTTAELLAAVENCTESLKAIVTNEDVAINETIIEAMRQNDKTVTIEGDITIEGGATSEGALVIEENIVCKNNAIIEGYVILEEGDFDTVEVLAGANLTVDGADVETIDNYGETTVKTGSSAINNYGTLNVKTNNGNITVKYTDGVTASVVNVQANLTYGKDLEGTWNVESGKTLTLSAGESLKGTLNLSGIMEGGDVTIKSAKGLASTLKVEGTLKNNVLLDGHKAVATDEEDADKLATLNIESTAKVYGKIAAKADAENMYDYNKVTIKDGAFFVSQSNMIDIKNVKAVYEYEGNIKVKDNVSELYAKIPVQANTIELDDILATEGITIALGGKYVNVNEILSTSSFATILSANKLTVKNVILTGTSGLTVNGDFKVTEEFRAEKGTEFTYGGGNLELKNIVSGIDGVGLDLTKATTTIISGNIEATDNIIVAAGAVLRGSSIDMNGHDFLFEPKDDAPAIHVESSLTVKDCTVSGTNAGAATNVNVPSNVNVIVYNGKTLTIASDAVINKLPSTTITFVSSKNSAKDKEDAEDSNVGGKVVNNGKIYGAAAWYGGATANETGNAAVTKQTWWTVGTGSVCTTSAWAE